MDSTNQKIIQAIIEKAKKVCPDSLGLIGIYGSAATGDVYEKSDLDLLILIRNDGGRKLGTGFILEDKGVGYDIYCTSLDGLRYDAECHHAHIAKLMDSKILYVQDEETYQELLQLRTQAKQLLASEERFQRVDALLDEAKASYANACLFDAVGRVRLEAFGVVQALLDALMLYHGRYFKRGVKRTFEELAAVLPDAIFASTVKKLVVCEDLSELRALLKDLLLYAINHTQRKKPGSEATSALAGTYEEMYSNWRNKVEEAAKNADAFASFANMCNFHLMLQEIGEDVKIGAFDVMEAYSPNALEENVRTFDRYLQKYEEVYRRAGIRVNRFSDVDAFVSRYLGE